MPYSAINAVNILFPPFNVYFIIVCHIILSEEEIIDTETYCYNSTCCCQCCHFFAPPFYAGFLLYADLSCYPKIVARVTPVIMIPDMTNAPINICSSFQCLVLYIVLSYSVRITPIVNPVKIIPDTTNAPITICSSFRFIFCSILFFGSECCHFCLLYCFVDNKAPHCYNEQSARCCCYHMIFSFLCFGFYISFSVL